MNPNGSWQLVAGLSALGFYLFLSVGVAVFLWSRTKQRLAIQETLQKLIDKGTDVTPEVIESLRRPAPKQTRAEILAGVMKFRYWGYFLVGLGTVIALNGLRYSDSPVKDLREMTSAGIVTFARASVRRARVQEGLSHGDIASLTDIPLGTVKSHIARGSARLRELLKDYGACP